LPLITNTDPDEPAVDDPLDTTTEPLDKPSDDDDATYACDAPMTDADPPALVPTPADTDAEPPSNPEPPVMLTDPACVFLPELDPTDNAIEPDTPADVSPVDTSTDPDSELDDDDIDPIVRTYTDPLPPDTLEPPDSDSDPPMPPTDEPPDTDTEPPADEPDTPSPPTRDNEPPLPTPLDDTPPSINTDPPDDELAPSPASICTEPPAPIDPAPLAIRTSPPEGPIPPDIDNLPPCAALVVGDDVISPACRITSPPSALLCPTTIRIDPDIPVL
jgi:hypothetical protein